MAGYLAPDIRISRISGIQYPAKKSDPAHPYYLSYRGSYQIKKRPSILKKYRIKKTSYLKKKCTDLEYWGCCLATLLLLLLATSPALLLLLQTEPPEWKLYKKQLLFLFIRPKKHKISLHPWLFLHKDIFSSIFRPRRS